MIRVRGDGKTKEGERLKAYMRRQPVLFWTRVNVSERPAKVRASEENLKRDEIPHQEREVEVEVRAARVRILPPRRVRGGKRPEPLDVNVVHVLKRQTGAKAEELKSTKELVELVLVTDLPVKTAEEAARVVKIYSGRSRIEMLFRTLKFDCRIERLLFRSVDRFLKCLALFLVIAWRLHYLQGLSEKRGQERADPAFAPAEKGAG